MERSVEGFTVALRFVAEAGSTVVADADKYGFEGGTNGWQPMPAVFISVVALARCSIRS
jgi:hypothetical protein